MKERGAKQAMEIATLLHSKPLTSALVDSTIHTRQLFWTGSSSLKEMFTCSYNKGALSRIYKELI